jgi:hypothetical protein
MRYQRISFCADGIFMRWLGVSRHILLLPLKQLGANLIQFRQQSSHSPGVGFIKKLTSDIAPIANRAEQQIIHNAKSSNKHPPHRKRQNAPSMPTAVRCTTIQVTRFTVRVRRAVPRSVCEPR